MGKKSDDAQNLVEEKKEDQTISSTTSSSRKKRREKMKKSKDAEKIETGNNVETDQVFDPDLTDTHKNDEQHKINSEKRGGARDKRRKKENLVEENDISDEEDGKMADFEDPKQDKVSSSRSRRPKTSKGSRGKKSSKTGRPNDSKLDLKESKENSRIESSENVRKSASNKDKRNIRNKRESKKEIVSEDDDETTRSSLNILALNDQRDHESSEDEHRPRKFRKNKEKSPRSKETLKNSDKTSKILSSSKKSKTKDKRQGGSAEGSKQSLRGVDNPVYDVDEHDEYSDGRNAYREMSALYGLDDDILDSPFEDGGEDDSEDEGKAYRLPPTASPIDLSPASPYLLQPHFVSTSGNPNTLSEPVNQIYREKVPGRFSKTSQKKISTIAKFSSNQVEPQLTKSSMTPLDLGLECQKVFRAIGVFSHGFLAGMAFWQLLMVYILSQEGLLHEMFPGDCQKPDQIEYCDQLKFVELYSPLSQPLHLVFYLLTTICTISIMDRYDIAQFDFRQLQMMLTFRSGGIAVAIYIITLIITLVSTRYDDKLSLHRVNETIYEDLDQEVLSSEISIWKALNLCRSIGVILGWFLISMRPNTDLLYKHLKKLSIFGGEKQGASYNANAPLKA